MSALGKEPNDYFTLPRAAVSPRQILCRVPDKRPSAKSPSPTFFFPRVLHRGLPSANPSPTAEEPLTLRPVVHAVHAYGKLVCLFVVELRK